MSTGGVLVDELLIWFSFIGRAICHQLHERTFQINETYLPICARDTGIYLGVLTTLVYLFITKKFKKTMIPNKTISFLLLTMLCPMMIDGIGSYLGFYETNNAIRLITGILFGSSLPFFLLPLLHSQNSVESPILKKISEINTPLFSAAILGLFVYHSLLPVLIISSLLILSLICWFSVLTSFLFLKVRHKSIRLLLAVSCSILSLIILSFVHSLSLGT